MITKSQKMKSIETLYNIQPYGYIYEITNLINGKSYIGLHRFHLNEKWRDYMGSGRLVKQAIAKYGEKNFSKELLCMGTNLQVLTQLESFFIRRRWDSGKAQYNLAAYTPLPQNSEQYLKTLKPQRANKSQSLKMLNKKRALEKSITLSVLGNVIVERYKREKSVQSVSSTLCISRNWVTQVLKENEIVLNHQNTKGKAIPLSRREKISKTAFRNSNLKKGAAGKIPSHLMTAEYRTPESRECKVCHNDFLTFSYSASCCSAKCRFSSQTKKLDNAYIKKLYLAKVPVNEIAQKTGVSPRTIYRRLKESDSLK